MAEDLAVSYGRAIAQIARAEGAADRVSDELFQFASAVEQTPELRDKLTDSSIPLEARSNAAAELLQRAHPATLAVVQMLIGADRIRHIGEIADAAVSETAEQRGASVASVRTAKPLTDEQRDALSQALSARAGRPVDLKITVDPDLVGGLVVQLGDSVIDGSVAKRLTDLRSSLSSV
ncbi:MAG: ATP synthase F1 subunit delta [Euzebya sp.]